MPTALIVDDFVMDRHLAGALVEKTTGLTPAYAANGHEALTVMEKELPEVVLTDLLMPEMDGLELVQEIRSKYPLVPVILMTAHGSEEIAIQALRNGAASYVPKRNLAQDLAETVESVLAAARGSRNQQRLIECLAKTEAQFILDNDPALIPPLLGYLQDSLSRLKICDEIGRIRVSVALQEALTNAIQHGNLEVSSVLREKDDRAYYALAEERRRKAPYSARRIYVTMRESSVEAVYTVRDEGPGFDPSQLPDPTDPSNLERVSGRGLLLIRTFMDEVYHNDKGNEITMIKRRDR
jgi:CheY-like chemotaxis protein